MTFCHFSFPYIYNRKGRKKWGQEIEEKKWGMK
jgi:hypothetical protein